MIVCQARDGGHGRFILRPRFNLMAAPFGSSQIIFLGGYNAVDGYMGDAFVLNVEKQDEQQPHLIEQVIAQSREGIKFMTHNNQCDKSRHGGIAGIVNTHKNNVQMITYRRGDA